MEVNRGTRRESRFFSSRPCAVATNGNINRPSATCRLLALQPSVRLLSATGQKRVTGGDAESIARREIQAGKALRTTTFFANPGGMKFTRLESARAELRRRDRETVVRILVR